MAISDDARAIVAAIIAAEAARTGGDRGTLIARWMETRKEIDAAVDAERQRREAEGGRMLGERLEAEAAAEQERRRLAGEEPLEPPGRRPTW